MLHNSEINAAVLINNRFAPRRRSVTVSTVSHCTRNYDWIYWKTEFSSKLCHEKFCMFSFPKAKIFLLVWTGISHTIYSVVLHTSWRLFSSCLDSNLILKMMLMEEILQQKIKHTYSLSKKTIQKTQDNYWFYLSFSILSLC